MPEPIPECDGYQTQLRSVRRLASAYQIDSGNFSPYLSTARLAAQQCYEACASILKSGGVVEDTSDGKYLSWTDIRNRLRNRLKELDGYERIAQNLPFSYWAGGTLENHENRAPRSDDRWVNYIENRHTITDHVRIDPGVLDQEIETGEEFASSLSNKEIAEWAIARVLAFCWDDVSAWLFLKEGQVSRMDFISLKIPVSGTAFDTGRDIGAIRFYGDSKLYISTCIRAILVRDSRAPRGFWVKTAFVSPA